MIKFINAEWLKAFFEADKGKGRTTPIDSLLALIDNAPSIDIVHCRECTYRDNRKKCPMRVFTGDNGFCCCGADDERRRG